MIIKDDEILLENDAERLFFEWLKLRSTEGRLTKRLRVESEYYYDNRKGMLVGRF